jgi:hypothetical protein
MRACNPCVLFCNEDPVLLALARASYRNFEYDENENSFLESAVQLMHRATAMRRDSTGAMLLFTWRTATGCVVVTSAAACSTRFTSNPLLHHSIDCFFRTTIARARGPFVGRRRHFRHAGSARMTCGALCKTRQKHALYTSRSVLREHLCAGQEACVARNQHLSLSAARREQRALLRARSSAVS